MVNKKLAKRVAVAVLSGAMALSTTMPVMAAQTVAVESSEAAAAAKTFTLTAGGTEITEEDNDTVYNALKDVQVDPDDVATSKKNVTTALDALDGYTYTDLNVTASGSTVTATFNLSDSKAYVATFSTVETKDLSEAENGQDVADAVDDFLADEDNTLRTYSGETLNSATVLAAIKNESTVSDALKTANLSDYTLGITNFSKTDSTYSGTLTLTSKDGTTVYTHAITGEYAASTDSSKTIVDNAVASIAATPIPDAGDADNTIKYINTLLTNALDGTGVTGASVKEVSDLYTAAKHGTNGSIVTTVTGGNNAKATVTFTLTESSDQKLKEADAKLAGTKGIFGTAGDAVYLTDEDGDLVADDDDNAVTDGKLYTIKTTSALSRSIQARTATVAADEDAVKDAVASAVADAVKDYDGDGVEYTTEVVSNKYAALDAAPTAVTDAFKDTVSKANVDNTGWYLVKVTASIDNDFYDDTQDESATNPEVSQKAYYVLVNTNKLKETKATAIDIADQTVVYKNDTKFDDTTSEKEDALTVSIAPTLTPTDSNSAVTWTVDKAVGTDGKTAIETDTYKIVDATTYGTDAAKLVLKEAGTYTITAKVGTKVKDTATITVTKTFKDVPTTAYYYNAVNDAYDGKVTNGTSADTFSPSANVSRAQFVTWLYNYAVAVDPTVAIDDDDVDINSTFSDVSNTAYYAKAVQWGYENNIVAGTTAATFSPNADVTRAQAVTFIWRAKDKPDTGAQGRTTENTTQFSDVTKGSYYEAAVTWGVNNEVVYGLSTTTFGPDQTATRAQGITFIARAYVDSDDPVFSGNYQ